MDVWVWDVYLDHKRIFVSSILCLILLYYNAGIYRIQTYYNINIKK